MGEVARAHFSLPFHFLIFFFGDWSMFYFKKTKGSESLGYLRLITVVEKTLELHSDNFELDMYMCVLSADIYMLRSRIGRSTGRRDDLGSDEKSAEDRRARRPPVRCGDPPEFGSLNLTMIFSTMTEKDKFYRIHLIF